MGPLSNSQQHISTKPKSEGALVEMWISFRAHGFRKYCSPAQNKLPNLGVTSLKCFDFA